MEIKLVNYTANVTVIVSQCIYLSELMHACMASIDHELEVASAL